MDEAWGRLENESAKAYEAFLKYLALPVRIRSYDRAWRTHAGISEDDRRPGTRRIAPSTWQNWASKFRWVERAKAYDTYHAERELEMWEERRRRARERDWEQSERLRGIVDEGIPEATRFFQRQQLGTTPGTPTIINEAGEVVRQGTPSQTFIAVTYNIMGLTRVLVDASKMQRLVLDEPTDNINNLSGATLDAALERALAQRALEVLPYGSKEGDASGTSHDDDLEASDDDDAEEGMGEV